jgi:predicted lipoprotein
MAHYMGKVHSLVMFKQVVHEVTTVPLTGHTVCVVGSLSVHQSEK